MSFPRYPEYKDSGVAWLGEVPGHWEVCALKRLLEIQNGSDHKHIEQAEGFPVIGSGGQFAYASDYLYDGESVLLGRKGTIDKPLYVTGKFWTVDTMYWSKIAPDACGRYAYYTALTIPFGYYSTNTALPSMTQGTLSAHIVARPPLEEQTAIATFLDRETAKIDALVAEQEKLITLLQEKRQAVISHAVTKGLDPNVPMKDSGVEWLGEVPAHWKSKRLKFLASNIKAGPFGSALTKDMYVDSGYRVYGQEQVIPGDFSIGDYYIDEAKFAELSQYETRTDDVLISCVGTFGKIAVVPADAAPGIINPRLIRLRTAKDVMPLFLAEVLRSTVTFEQFSVLSRGGTMDVINIGTLSDIWIALPPIAEQSAILNEITTQMARFDALMAQAQSAIILLQERRTALISAAVTGQIDVRGLAGSARTPDFIASSAYAASA